MLARTLGAPGDPSAGLFLHKKLHEEVKEGEVLMSFYSDSENKLKMALELAEEKAAYQIE